MLGKRVRGSISGSIRGPLRRQIRRHSRRVFVVPVAGLHLFLVVHPSAMSAQSSRGARSTDLALLNREEPANPANAAASDRTAEAGAPIASRTRAENSQVQRAGTHVGAAELGSLVTTVGQFGFLPIGWQREEAAETASSVPTQPTVCQVKVLNALNTRFPDANLTAANIVPETLIDRRFAVANVTIRGSEAQLAKVNKGRFLPHKHAFFGILIGYGPSLHIVSKPSFLDPHALAYTKTLFTAHLDSAWPNTPVGLFVHFVLDVIRPKSRNPCPG